MRTLSGFLVAVLLGIALGTASGQSGKRVNYTAGFGATYGNLVGGDFSGSRAGVGFDANAGVVLGRWQLGAGYDRTNHSHADTDGDYVISNVYLEPRLLITGASHRWSPYAVVRLGRSMASYQGVLGITDKAHGYLAGIGGGCLWPIANHVQADAGIHYARLSHDYGTGGYAAAEKGGQMNVRFGVRVGSGR